MVIKKKEVCVCGRVGGWRWDRVGWGGGIGGDEDIDQSVGQGQPSAPKRPISLHTYERCYRDPYKWSGLDLA